MSLVLLALLLSVTVASLIARERKRRRSAIADRGAGARAGAAPSGLRALLVVLALVALGEAVIARSPDPPSPADPVERAHRLREAGLHEHAEAEMAGRVAAHLDSVAVHYEFIHVALEERGTRERYRQGRDRPLIDFYQRMSAATRGARRDVALFGLGLCWSLIGDYPRAIARFDWFLAAFVTLCFVTFAINAAHLPHAAAERVFVTDLTGNLGVLVPIWIYARIRIGAGRAAVPSRKAVAQPAAQPGAP